MIGMLKVVKPLAVIILAVVIAAGAAYFLSRRSEEPTASADSTARVDISGGGHFRGPEKAQLTLVEFGDYQCPSCGAHHPLVQEILHRFPDVRLEFHHYPLISIHPNAMAAAKAAEAAGEQGHYWEMHDMLFEHQQDWAPKPDVRPEFVAMAIRLGLNVNTFMQAMESPKIQDRILQDVDRAQVLKIDAVPTFFINGERIHVYNLSIEDFAKAIEEHRHK